MFGFSSELMKFWKYGKPYFAVIANRAVGVRMIPVEVRRDVVGRDWKREDAPLASPAVITSM